MIDDKTARIRELEQHLRDRNARLRRLEEQLADRDAAWDRAVRDEFDDETRLFETVDDFIASIRERMEAEGGGS